MKIGMVGLGRMGANMALRLLRGGHEVAAFAPDVKARAVAAEGGATAHDSVASLVSALPSPRAVWVMVPAGDVTEATLDALGLALEAGDTVVDGGNSNYKDTQRRAARFEARGIHYVDCGTSGGVWGLEGGYALMIGGDESAVERLRPVFETLAPAKDRGWGRVGDRKSVV